MTAVELRVADSAVGELRYRGRIAPDPAIAAHGERPAGAVELERSRSPEWESEEVAGAFVEAVLGRKVTDRGDIVARAAELGADLERGRGADRPRRPACRADGEWRARVTDPGAASTARARSWLAGGCQGGEVAAEVAVIVPAGGDEQLAAPPPGWPGSWATALPAST